MRSRNVNYRYLLQCEKKKRPEQRCRRDAPRKSCHRNAIRALYTKRLASRSDSTQTVTNNPQSRSALDYTQSLSFLLVIERLERARCGTGRETGVSDVASFPTHSPRSFACQRPTSTWTQGLFDILSTAEQGRYLQMKT